MKLRDLLAEVPGIVGVSGDLEVTIACLVSDSRQKEDMAGGVFFCISGAHFDAHRFAPQVVERGAAALVVERILPEVQVPQVQVENMREAMSHMAAAFYGHPARKLKMAGVTGTKGKTTTTYLLKAIMEAGGLRCGLIGTTGNMIGETMISSGLTTPDPIDLQRTLRQMVDAGAEFIAMEASAHALDMHRLDGIVFDAVGFTNISQDHLDYFVTMERYWRTKKRLFTPKYARNAAFNVDDDCAEGMMEGVTLPTVTYGIREAADIYARDIEITENGVSFELVLHGAQTRAIHLRLTGTFNVYNSLTAAAL
ncbi:MAG TPA: Mur ligase family protein, partial [Clostridia bacterium]|nr:Mur ligase family protein [Clostridia bacterium]